MVLSLIEKARDGIKICRADADVRDLDTLYAYRDVTVVKTDSKPEIRQLSFF